MRTTPYIHTLSTGVLACLSLFASISTGFAACPVEHPDSGESEYAFAAGCLIKVENKLLAIRHKFTGKLGIPAGFSKASETARCTAYRETLEESGLRVTVHELLKENDNGFRLFRCELSDAVDISDTLAVPASGVNEISEVLWLDPLPIPRRQWRFPDQQSDLIELFKSIRTE